MRYAIKYYYGCKAMERASEIILKYEKVHKKLSYSIRDYSQGQRIVLDITGYNSETIIQDNLEIWKKALEGHKKMAIKMRDDQIDLIKDLVKIDMPYFLDTVVDNFEKLGAVAALQVSDVYVCNELGFSIKEVSAFCKSKGINVRVYPNIAQSSCEQFDTDSFKKFFIRPEDLCLYENYVDIIEFYVDSLDRQNVLYEIYKSGIWDDDLSILILGLKENIQNNTILPNFGATRLNCKKKCSIGQCATCDRVRDFLSIAERITESTNKIIEIRRKDESSDKDRHS